MAESLTCVIERFGYLLDIPAAYVLYFVCTASERLCCSCLLLSARSCSTQLDVSLVTVWGSYVGQREMWMLLCDGTVIIPMTMQSLALDNHIYSSLIRSTRPSQSMDVSSSLGCHVGSQMILALYETLVGWDGGHTYFYFSYGR
jgi:hypothetical protein